MAIRPGDLRHRVTLQSPSTTSDGMGGSTITWTDVATVWAAVWPVKGREYLEAQKLEMQITHKVRLRYSMDISGIAPRWRIEFDGRYFDIRAVINPDERNEYLDLVCMEII